MAWGFGVTIPTLILTVALSALQLVRFLVWLTSKMFDQDSG
jgi:hypothetical protein